MTKTLINYRWEIELPPHRSALKEWKFWEKERLAAMYNTIRRDDVILDVGAERGDMTILFGSWGGQMIVVEPSPGFWPYIKYVFEANELSPIMCWPVLASNETTEKIAPGYPSSANDKIEIDVGFSHVNEKPNIPIMKIDDMELPEIDIVNMNIEGTEYEALQGAEQTIKRDKPIMFISIHPEFMWREHQHTIDDLLIMLDSWDYDATYLATDHEQHYMFRPRI